MCKFLNTLHIFIQRFFVILYSRILKHCTFLQQICNASFGTRVLVKQTGNAAKFVEFSNFFAVNLTAPE